MSVHSRALSLLAAAVILAVSVAGANAQDRPVGGVPVDRVYQGPVHLPDFAGHYAIIQIGCGIKCSFALVGGVTTGEVFDFPYGGETYRPMQTFPWPNLEDGALEPAPQSRWLLFSHRSGTSVAPLPPLAFVDFGKARPKRKNSGCWQC